MVVTTRATSSPPGATGRIYYGENEDEHFFVWPGLAPRQNMPLLVYCKPGHTFNMGERVMDPHTSSSPALGDAVDLLYTYLNCPIVGIEFRPPFSADSPKREPFSNRPWPGQVCSVAKVMVYLREHATDTALWGANGTIDPSRIAWLGSSSGHTLGLLLATIPPGKMPIHGANGLTQGLLAQDHRPDAVVGLIGQIDWTQFALDPAALSGPFKFDIMQYFFGIESALGNTALGKAVKKSASPWWWLPYLEPARTAFWGAWGQRPTAGTGASLTPALWLPGTIQNTAPRAFFDPHHYFQAQPWEAALKQAGVKRAKTIWGTNSDNPLGSNNTNTPDLANDILSFFKRTLQWAPVV